MFFFFNDTATTEIYTLSLHDALPISRAPSRSPRGSATSCPARWPACLQSSRRRSFSTSRSSWVRPSMRSEEHTSELQSQFHLVCRLLLEKKKKTNPTPHQYALTTYHL